MQAQTETTTADTDETVSPLETNFGNEKPVVTVPYSSLRPPPLNARTKPLSNVPALAASIRAKGLLQNLVVHELKGSRGKPRRYGVCAGQRREAALDLLHEQNHIGADYRVPVRIVSEGEALAISLSPGALAISKWPVTGLQVAQRAVGKRRHKVFPQDPDPPSSPPLDTWQQSEQNGSSWANYVDKLLILQWILETLVGHTG